MLQVLINLLTPIFEGMGVSAVDVDTYIHNLAGYIYAILGTLVLAIVVIVVTQFVIKKGLRHVVVINAVLAWVLIVTVLANVICFGPMYSNVSLMLNGQVSISDETIAHSREVIQEIGEEGMVLVKNDGLLPLTTQKNLNVFGWDSISPVLGGTGSGGNGGGDTIDILRSLKDAGFTTNQSLTDMYIDYQEGRISTGNGVFYTNWTLPEPPIENYTDALMNEATSFSDTAVIVIGRSGGEGKDEPMDVNAVINGTYDIADQVANGNESYAYFKSEYTNNGSYDDFASGEHYLELSRTEKDMVEKVCSTFEKVIVVVNANNAMELGWVDQYDSIGAVILAPGPGTTGFEALGKILSGEVNPSGKTADTFVYDLFQTPTAQNFGNFSFTNVEDLKAAVTAADAAYEGNLAFVNYVEGIYVGYKFYETAAEEGLIDYDDYVQYPFGYGLSYTTFTQEIQNFADNGDTISFDVTVTNTGSVAGKDVVEVYFTPPYTNGGIEKASVNLVEFGKTKLLESGASDTIHFDIPKEEMASYDAYAIKTANGGYVLEAGEYEVSIRSDSHTVLDVETFTVAADIDYSTDGRSSDLVAAVNHFQDYSAGSVTYLSRADGFANYEAAIAAPSQDAYVMDAATRAIVEEKTSATYDPTRYDDPNAVMPTTGASGNVKLADLTGKNYDDPQWDALLDQLTVDEMVQLVNLGGFQTVAISSIDKMMTMEADGPAGLSNWVVGVSGTAFPVETMLSQTWNKELAEKMGDAIGAEYSDANTYGWYGPAMNIHRSAFGGRNFEYYSEDGVLSAHIAAKEVSGAAKHGVYAYIKHFALNDQETNRCSFLLTYSTEQAIREIYLKPFERVVKENRDGPLAIMSSFNFIGPIASIANPNLLKTVLRDEWGYRGMVLSDWNGSYGYQITDDAIRNGNDIMLGFNTYETNRVTDTNAASCVLALRQASKNILYSVANSGNYTNTDGQGGLDNMTKTFIGIDVGIAVVLIAVEALVILNYRKKHQKT